MPGPLVGMPPASNPQVVTGQLNVQGSGTAGTANDQPELVLNLIASQTSNAMAVQTSAGAVVGGFNNAGLLFGGQQSGLIIGAATAVAITLTAAQSGATVVSLTTSGAQVINLPTVASGATAGMWFRVVTGVGSTVQMQLGTTDSAKVYAKVSNAAAAASIVSTATTGNVHNTTGTIIVGDNLTVVFTGTDWYAVSQSGTWAAT